MKINKAVPNPPLLLLGKKIAFSTLVQYGGKILQIALATLALKQISSFLSDAGFSYYSAISEFALFISMLGNLGLFSNLIRMMADHPSDGKVFSQTFFLRIITGILIFSLSIFLLFVSNSWHGSVDYLFLSGSALFLGALLFDYITSVCDGMLQANYMMGRATLALVLGRALNLLLIVLVIKLLGGQSDIALSLLLIFTSTLAGSLFTAGLSFYFVSQRIKLQWHIDSQFIFKVFRTSLPFGLINIFNNLYFRFLPEYFVHQDLTKGILGDAQFNSFSISFRIAQVLSLASTFLMFSVLPGLTQYIDQKHYDKAKKLIRKITFILLAGAFLLISVGTLVGPLAIEILTHKKYFLEDYWFIFPMMLLLAGLSYLYDLFLIVLFALKQEIAFLKGEIIALALALILFYSAQSFQDPHWRLIIILSGALIGEAFIVIRGFLLLKRSMKPSNLLA